VELRHLKKSVVFLFFTFILVSTLTNFYSPMPDLAQAVTIPTMYVDPPNVGSGLIVGDSFTVDVMISGTDINENTDVYAWQVMMTWDNSLLEYDAVTFGDFLNVPRIGSWGLLTADAPAGQKIIYVTSGSFYAIPGGWGGAVLIQDDSNSETNTVIDQSGNMLTLLTNLEHTYTVAADGGAYPNPNLQSVALPGPAGNRVMVGQTTLGAPPGVSGSGWLCTLTFNVLADGETALDIDSEFMGDQTYIMNTLKEVLGDDPSGSGDPGWWQAELFKESGEFILPWDEDFDGDGSVAIFDLSSVGVKFGEGPAYEGPEDLNDDGYVNIADLSLVSIAFGIYANA